MGLSKEEIKDFMRVLEEYPHLIDNEGSVWFEKQCIVKVLKGLSLKWD
jgi:hypothetical protein